MDKLKMHSLDGVARNIELIGNLFPNAVTEVMRDGRVERAIDFDVLRQELSDCIVEGREERYQFTWPDKKKAMLAANAPITATLRPIVADSVGRDGTPGGFDSENLYIEGDNLEVLKLLQETYLGKVKMIYIDPPYNTGNDFIYADDFKMESEEWKVESGEWSEEGDRLFKNTDTNGRFHFGKLSNHTNCNHDITSKTRYAFGNDDINLAGSAIRNHFIELVSMSKRSSTDAFIGIYLDQCPVRMTIDKVFIIYLLKLKGRGLSFITG